MTTALLLCNQPENYLRKPYFASFDVKKKNPIYSSDTETGRSRCWEKNHLKIISKRERMCRRDYRINLPHLIRYVTHKDQKIKKPFKSSFYTSANIED